MVEEELEALLSALPGKHLERVLFVGRRVDNVPLALLRAPHGETVVVFARNRDVLHAGGFGERDPLGGVERGGLKRAGNFSYSALGIFRLFMTHSPSPRTL